MSPQERKRVQDAIDAAEAQYWNDPKRVKEEQEYYRAVEEQRRQEQEQKETQEKP